MHKVGPEWQRRLEAFEQALAAELGVQVKVEFPEHRGKERPPELERPHENSFICLFVKASLLSMLQMKISRHAGFRSDSDAWVFTAAGGLLIVAFRAAYLQKLHDRLIF